MLKIEAYFCKTMFIRVVYIIFLGFSFQLQAQKVIEKSIDAKAINTLIIDGNTIFRINIETLNTNVILAKTRSEGEYGEHNILATKVQNDTLFVSSKLQPFFTDSNNKSTAHKVIATDLDLVIPQHLSIYIKSDIATTNLQGVYNDITIELINGNCILKSYAGNAIINTIHGYIDVQTRDAKIEAFTKNGNITSVNFFQNEFILKLNSINGNIRVTKTEK